MSAPSALATLGFWLGAEDPHSIGMHGTHT